VILSDLLGLQLCVSVNLF